MSRDQPVTYIYALLDPRDETVRYVGKSNHPERRLRAHQKLGRGRNGGKSDPKSAWVRELHALKLAPAMVLLQAVPRSCWKHAEMLWIERYWRLGAPLLNRTEGGDGAGSRPKATPRAVVLLALHGMARRVREELPQQIAYLLGPEAMV